MLWDLTDAKRLYTLDAGDIIHALCFSPNRYWLCAATQTCIKVGLAWKILVLWFGPWSHVIWHTANWLIKQMLKGKNMTSISQCPIRLHELQS